MICMIMEIFIISKKLMKLKVEKFKIKPNKEELILFFI